MSTNEENSLATEAWHNIGSCCETLCNRDTVAEYIKSLEEKIKELETELQNKD